MNEIIKQFGAPAGGTQLICFPFAGDIRHHSDRFMNI